MLRVIFDTNIYGRLIEEKYIEKIRPKIKNDHDFKIYGCKSIRKELRETPKHTTFGKLNKRNLILNLYDDLTGKRYLKDSIKIDRVALKFYHAYRKCGGIHSWVKTNIDVDFTLVACASVNKLDIVVSDDQKTLLSRPALQSYKQICVKNGLWLPNFWKYSDLKLKYKF